MRESAQPKTRCIKGYTTNVVDRVRIGNAPRVVIDGAVERTLLFSMMPWTKDLFVGMNERRVEAEER